MQLNETIPSDLKQDFFMNTNPPDLSAEVIGFDLDNCLVQYDIYEITRLIVKTTLKDLIGE